MLDPAADSPASQVAPAIVGAYDDPSARRARRGVDVVTYEFENVPAEPPGSSRRCGRCSRRPPRSRSAQDRLAEKQLFESGRPPGAAVRAGRPLDALDDALAHIGTPAVLKTRRLGYDGKGQAVIRDAALAEDAWDRRRGRRVARGVRAVRPRALDRGGARRDGDDRLLPARREPPRDGILRLTLAPAPGAADALQAAAERHARAVMDALDYVGVLAIELFCVGEPLLANEMARASTTRGHWTIEGAETSQFEQHLRAVVRAAAGLDRPRGRAMVNLIGAMPDPGGAALAGAHLHDYGKAPRPGASSATSRCAPTTAPPWNRSCSACSSWSKRPSRDRWRRSARSRTTPRWAPTDAPGRRGLWRTPA